MHMHAWNTCMHTDRRTYIHTCMLACIHIIHSFMHTCQVQKSSDATSFNGELPTLVYLWSHLHYHHQQHTNAYLQTFSSYGYILHRWKGTCCFIDRFTPENSRAGDGECQFVGEVWEGPWREGEGPPRWSQRVQGAHSTTCSDDMHAGGRVECCGDKEQGFPGRDHFSQVRDFRLASIWICLCLRWGGRHSRLMVSLPDCQHWGWG